MPWDLGTLAKRPKRAHFLNIALPESRDNIFARLIKSAVTDYRMHRVSDSLPYTMAGSFDRKI